MTLSLQVQSFRFLFFSFIPHISPSSRVSGRVVTPMVSGPRPRLKTAASPLTTPYTAMGSRPESPRLASSGATMAPSLGWQTNNQSQQKVVKKPGKRGAGGESRIPDSSRKELAGPHVSSVKCKTHSHLHKSALGYSQFWTGID